MNYKDDWTKMHEHFREQQNKPIRETKMAEAQTQNDAEETEIDTTAEKAKEIGDAMGAKKAANPEEEYAIQEVNEDDEIDKKISKTRAPEKKERKELSNKEKRALRKERINQKFSERDTRIERLARENEELKRWKSEVDGRLHGMNKVEIERAYADTQQTFLKAEQDSLAAFNEGDGMKHLKALQAMKDADDRMKMLRDTHQKIENLSSAEKPTSREQPQHDQIVSNRAKEWGAKNKWYRPNDNDVDSEIAKTVAGVLIREGFDPKSDDYWDELDDRLATKLPDKYESSQEGDDDEPGPVANKNRTAPPVGGASNRSDLKGKKTINLPTSYIKMLKENGIWDDIPRRNKVLKERERILKEADE